MVERIHTAWSPFLASYAGLADTELLESGTVGAWSVRDVIAHVTWWEAEALAHLPAIQAGGKTPRYSVLYGGIDAFNALMTERTRSQSLAEVLAAQAETHRRLLDLVDDAPEAAFRTETRWRRRLRLDTYGHYPLHTRAILHWRDGRAGVA